MTNDTDIVNEILNFYFANSYTPIVKRTKQQLLEGPPSSAFSLGRLPKNISSREHDQGLFKNPEIDQGKCKSTCFVITLQNMYKKC